MIGLGLPPGRLAVLCLGAHPDDIEIGCGGTLLALATHREVSATNVVLSGSAQRQDEARAAATLFWSSAATHQLQTYDLPDGRLPAHWGEVKEILTQVATAVQPDLILAPRTDDSHQDHRLLASLVTTAWRDALVLHYEIPKWDGDLRPVTHYVPLTADLARRKVELLDQSFGSQRERDWWDAETFLGLMRLRGVECRAQYAEGYVTTKAVLAM